MELTYAGFIEGLTALRLTVINFNTQRFKKDVFRNFKWLEYLLSKNLNTNYSYRPGFLKRTKFKSYLLYIFTTTLRKANIFFKLYWKCYVTQTLQKQPLQYKIKKKHLNIGYTRCLIYELHYWEWLIKKKPRQTKFFSLENCFNIVTIVFWKKISCYYFGTLLIFF